MDWQGQKLAERLMQVTLLAFAAMAFITGYIMGSFHTMFLIYGGGLFLAALIVLPSWPFFNRNPLPWLDAAGKQPLQPPAAARAKQS
ncbi:Signal peptidase complex subunit 1 [Linum grandiflorum]